ncbi:MAG: VanW family protein [Candidatus Nanopelagicales bacterium]
MGNTEPAGAQPAPSRVLLWVAAGVVLALLVVGYLALALGSGSTAASGTTVEGVAIGGMTEDEAASAVEDAIGPTVTKKLKVTAGDQTFTIKAADAGLSLDAAASVAPAFGHTWNPISLLGRLGPNGDQLPAVVTVDDAAMAAELQTIADAITVPAVEPAVEVDKGAVTVTPGTPGESLDVDATSAALAAAAARPRAPVAAVVATVEPTVNEEAAQTAGRLATAAIAGPVTVTAGTVTADIPAKAVGRALSFTASDGALVPSLDGAILHKSIAKELKPIEVKGRDASFKIRRGTVKVVKSKVGEGVSDDELAAAVAGVLDKPAGQRSVTVSVGTREPDLTTEEAKALGIHERLSTFTQYFPYAAYRLQNIGQAARRVNGTLLQPGQTFSMNDTIKERTKKNGYTEGFVVGEGGVFAEALGGGVSTATTATWTAAFFAGMERVQTVAHSIYISRYKPGLEATVAWGIFDMKFKNPYDKAVFITASATGTSVTVSFWGTRVYSDITAEFGKRENVVPFDTIHDTSKTCLGQGGVDGFTITVDRVFYQDGKEVRREPITTRYKPAPEVICGPDKGDKPGKGDKPPKNGGGSASPSASSTDKPSKTPSDQPTKKPSKTPTPTETDVFSND